MVFNNNSNKFLFYFRYPFNDSEHASLFVKISRGQFSLPEWMSCKARCLVRSLLRRDPTERLTADDVLYHPWLTQGSSPAAQSAIGDHETPVHAIGFTHHRALSSDFSSSSSSSSSSSLFSDQVVPVWTPENNSDDEN